MITCPEFDTNIHNLRFNLMFDALAVFSIIIHFYCIYCILYRSPAQMKTYHWYLLWHQVASFFGDIFINAIAKPIVFIPLPLGYLNGLGAGFVHPKVALGAGQFFVTLACVTSLHLFIYRYLCVSGNSQGNGVRFPLWSKILLGYNYMIPVVNFICTATANDHTEQVLAEWAKEYSCVTPSLMSIPHIWAYNKMECMWRTVLVCWCDMINMAIGVPYFVRVTFKAIDVKVMSENTRRMQRNFLIQLMLQASVPMIFVMLPALIFAPTVMLDIFGIPSILSAIIHVYTMYCIVFRSSLQMRTYRWYLLWHQVVSFVGDFWINAVTKPMIYVPLPMGYLNGLGDGIMHPKVGLATGQFFVVLACVTTLHLLLYRYICVSSLDRFPLRLKLVLGYNYVNPFINLVATATAGDHTEQVLIDWAKEYSCVTPSLLSIPHLWAYDKMECMIRTLSVVWYDFINYAIVLPYFVKATFKAIDVKIMSEATRRMQRNFLIQLLLQASIPMICVMIPAFVIASAVMFDIFGGRYLNDVAFICLSLFGVSGAIVLIVMIPNYHWWWRKPSTSVVPSMMSTSNLP